MKKICSLIVFFLFLTLISNIALADEIDLSGHSLQELIEYRKAIEKEIVSRLNESEFVQFYSGYYIAGKDIPVGEYIITMIKGENYTPSLFVFDNEEKFMSFQKTQVLQLAIFRALSITEGEPIHLRLEENNVLFIVGGEFTIRKHMSYMDML